MYLCEFRFLMFHAKSKYKFAYMYIAFVRSERTYSYDVCMNLLGVLKYPEKLRTENRPSKNSAARIEYIDRSIGASSVRPALARIANSIQFKD